MRTRAQSLLLSLGEAPQVRSWALQCPGPGSKCKGRVCCPRPGEIKETRAAELAAPRWGVTVALRNHCPAGGLPGLGVAPGAPSASRLPSLRASAPQSFPERSLAH